MQYDLVFLDLDMPILNGFEACQNIMEFVKVFPKADDHNRPSEDSNVNYQKKFWLKDLNAFSEGLMDQENPDMETMTAFYEKVKYHSLNLVKKPFIFAFSALITPEIEQQAKDTGFYGCLESPLSISDINNIINMLDDLVHTFMKQNLDDPELLERMKKKDLNLIMKLSEELKKNWENLPNEKILEESQSASGGESQEF